MTYTLYLKPATRAESGDATFTDGKGRFRTFFWGAGAWLGLSVDEKLSRLLAWLTEVGEAMGPLDPRDVAAVESAVVRSEGYCPACGPVPREATSRYCDAHLDDLMTQFRRMRW